jgi:hypothetical protein
VEERTFTWGLTAGAFVLVLVFSSSHGAWWRARSSPATRAQPTHFVSTDAFPSNPFAAQSEFLPAPNPPAVAPVAEGNPVRAIAPSEPEQLEPQSEDSTAEADYEAMAVQRNRGTEHGSRTH